MKRLLILCFICSSCLVQAQQLAYNKQDILNIVYQITLEKNIDVLVSKQPLPPNTAITTLYKPFVSPEYDSWFVFLDEHPYESWWHDCKYIFIEIKTGEYEVFKMSYPPDIDNMEIIKKYIFDDAEELTAYKIPEYETPKNAVTSDNEWAVIINGGISDYFNHQRYWNHISFIYSTLIHEYGYQKSHVFVLCSDGTNPGIDRHLINGGFDSSPLDLDGDGLADIQYSATKSNIGTVFDILSDSLDVNDNLFIYTTDHGGQINGQDVFLYLWGDTIGDDLFATEVNKVNAGKINTCMVQCHSGGFIDNLQATNRVIATACRYDESAYAMNDLQYSEFTYYWISAVAGKTPTGTTTYADTDGDGFVSMSEAFNYAEFNDTQSETPQYNSTPISLGNNLSLIGMITRIIGPSILCSSGGSYSISNVPSGASITWSSSTGIARTSAQGSNPCN
ncbi:MAG: C13 family peptidase, partial [Bacteroidales bacterium]